MIKYILLMMFLVTSLPSYSNSWYAGANIGQAYWDGNNSRDSTAYSLYIGKALSEQFSIEGGFVDFSDNTKSTTQLVGYYEGSNLSQVEQYLDTRSKIEASGLFVNALGIFYQHKKFNLYGKIGYAYLTADTSIDAYQYDLTDDDTKENILQLAIPGSNDSSSEFSYGFGVNYQNFRLEYTSYTEISVISLGYQVLF
jgi:hypothetical protein